jgi:predicted glycosyltransferase
VLVTVGGGGDGYNVIDAYLQALEMTSPPAWRTVIVSGPLMPASQQQALENRVAGRGDVEISRVTTKMSTLMAHAELIVTMAGYNSSVEVLSAKKPAILIPRAAPRAEQRLRAAMLSEIGVAWSVSSPGDISDLARLLRLAQSGAKPPALGSELINLDGAQRAGDNLDALVSIDDTMVAAAS